MPALYIHVPFCAQVCHYCDFAVLKAPSRLHSEYVDLLLEELALRMPGGLAGISTAYMGGGTPSVLSPLLLESLLGGLRLQGLGPLLEFSMEFNPEQVRPELLEVARAGGVDRYSLGLQSLDDSLLKALGRTHTARRGLEAWEALRSAGFRSGSVDLMFHLPGQSLEGFLDDVKTVAARKPEHVSFYGLSVEESTLLGQQVRKGLYSLDEDLYAPMYTGALRCLEEAGLLRYEVSNFARPGHESLHNQVYWLRKPYIGVGPGAHSYLDGVRLAGPRAYARWREWVSKGCPAAGLERDELSKSARLTEALWLSLRCRPGLDRKALAGEFGHELPREWLKPYEERGWLLCDGNTVSLQGEGWLFMDSLVSSLQARWEKTFPS